MKYPFIITILLSIAFTHLFGQYQNSQYNLDRPNIVWITSEDNSKHYLSLFDEHGVETPNIAALAEEGLQFTHTFSNAPVCSVARSTLITGCYAPRIGAQYHRKINKVPMPKSLEMFPQYLREAGYYTTNNSKEDYNLDRSAEVWDESSKDATWKNRAPGQPFFHMVNITVTHEGNLHFTRAQMAENKPKTPVNDVFVQPNHPQTEVIRYTNAYYRDRIQLMDKLLGDIVAELEEADQMENTIIFYFGDHGGVLPGSKGYLYETGLHVPLVVYIPLKYRKTLGVEVGKDVPGFVSFVDFGPTVLRLAGLKVPEEMDGRPFLGEDIDINEINARNETYSYADRFDEKYDMVRAVRKGKYKYIRSFQPFNVDALMNNYRYQQLAYREWDSLYRASELDEAQSRFFQPRPPELLFDVEADPYEINNLASDPKYQKELLELREKLNTWLRGMPDLSFFPEYVLINEAFDNPVKYGRSHRQAIKNYLDIANLCLGKFDEVKGRLKAALESDDPWQRYWALIACTSMDDEVTPLAGKIIEVAESDSIPLVRVQAALFLALKQRKDPVSVMTQALYDARYPAEGLLILNSIVLMRDWLSFLPSPELRQAGLLPAGSSQISFDLQLNKINPAVRNEPQVQRRLEYLELM